MSATAPQPASIHASDTLHDKAAASSDPPAPAAPETTTTAVDNNNLDNLADRLSKVALKQQRFLSSDTHSYEHFSLPATRVSSL